MPPKRDNDAADADDAAGEGEKEAGRAIRNDATGDEEDESLLIATKRVTKDEFFARAEKKAAPPIRGDTLEERVHWSRPRRWDVRIWDLRIANVSDKKRSAFCNVMFGTNREEFLVKSKNASRPRLWLAGGAAKEFRTQIVSVDVGDPDFTELSFDQRFEWHGSYMDLEQKTLRIEMWNFSGIFVNKFDSYYEEPLVTFAKGSIGNEIECVKMDRFGNGKVRARITFNLFLQEIYDFELNLSAFRISDFRRIDQALTLFKEGEAALTNLLSKLTVEHSDELERKDRYQQKIELVMPGNRRYWSRSKSFASISEATSARDFMFEESIGHFYFRGTCSDLNIATAQVRIYTNAPPSRFGLARRPRGSKGQWTLHSVAQLPLHGAIDNCDIKAELLPAPWMYTMPGGDAAYLHRMGFLQGHLSTEYKPRYRQLDDMQIEVEDAKSYLFVKVVKVDRIVTPDTRPTDQVDTWVEATFDGVTRKTRMRQNDISPTYNEELIFEIQLAQAIDKAAALDEARLWEELERKGPVHFDLWTHGQLSNEHLGCCEVFLSEILHDRKGTPTKTVPRKRKDARGEHEEVQVRAFRGFKRLSYVWGDGSNSHLFAEMWFQPDLGQKAKLKMVPPLSLLPQYILDQFDSLLEKWTKQISTFGRPEALVTRRDQDREFPVTVCCQWKTLLNLNSNREAKASADGASGEGAFFVPRFVTLIKPPPIIKNPNAVMHYISCFPYAPKLTSEAMMIYTPDFFCKLRRGDALDHAALHCSMMLGLMERAYVCIGTSLTNERHAWVATFGADGSVRFWDPFMQRQRKEGKAAGTFQLHNRFAHPEFVVGGQMLSRLSKDDVQAELDRRRWLSVQWAKDAGLGPLTIPPEQGVHKHALRYADMSTCISSHSTCAVCGLRGARPGFWRGFHCEAPGCQYCICWGDARKALQNKVRLDGLAVDVTAPFDFAYGDEKRDEFLVAAPYRTIELVFNQSNVWANLQHQDPTKIFWDLWNPMYWHAFLPRVASFQPCFHTDTIFRELQLRDEVWVSKTRKDLLRQVIGGLQRERSLLNLETTFVRNHMLTSFLEAGLKLHHQYGMCEDSKQAALAQRLREFEALLKAKTPPKHKLQSMVLHFNFCDPDLVVKGIVDRCDFIESRQKTASFAVALHLRALPGGVSSLYVYVCEMHRLSDLEIKDELQGRAKSGRERQREEEEALQAVAALREARRADGSATLGLAQKFRNEFDAKRDAETARLAAKGAALEHQDRQPREAASGPPPRGSAAARKRRAMTGFETAVASRHMRVTVTEAEYVGSKAPGSYAMRGGAIGNGPLKGSGAGKYFEVKVKRVGDGHPDGLCLGVTTRSPDDLSEIPETMEQVGPCWMAGFKNEFWDGAKGSWTKVPWKNERLAVGDCVGFLVSHGGQVVVAVNGNAVVRWTGAIPSYAPLYAVVDLLGNCDMVELVRGAQPPEAVVKEGGEAPARRFMAGFHSGVRGRNVDLSSDGLVAKHIGKKVEDLFGGLIGDGPIQSQPDGSLYFEVRVEGARPGRPDGLGIGVGPASPSEVVEMPQTIDALAACWVAGFDGQMFDSTSGQWAKLAWSPKSLSVGDRVGVVVTVGGLMRIFVNGQHKANGPRGIPVREPLFALVDLVGCTTSVRLCPFAMPPPPGSKETKRQQGVKMAAEMTAFANSGKLVALSKDGKSGTYRGDTGTELNGGMLGNGPLKRFEAGWYFEVKVSSVRDHPGELDGMAIGVTTHGPHDLGSSALPQTMDEMDPCWIMGFDGSQWDGVSLSWSKCTWRPVGLSKGDVVGMLVTLAGEMRVFVNGKGVAQGPTTVPTDRPLFGVVDLIGATMGVALTEKPQPPANIEISGQERAAPAKASKAVEAPLPALVHKRFGGWSCEPVGKSVQVSSDRLTLSHTKKPQDLHGGAIGDGQLPCTTAGVYFEVAVDRVGAGEPDGLAIGVTATPPSALAAIPETCDKVPNSWLIGFNGSMWDGKANKFTEANWQAANLRAGDRVGVSVALETGAMSLYVNGKRRAVGPTGIPCSRPLFALVDLIGNTTAVTLKPEAKLPNDAPSSGAGGGFSRAAVGRAVRLTADGFGASKPQAAGEEDGSSHGTVMSAAPIQSFPGIGRYFEVVVDKTAPNRSKQPDGLAVGVTSRPPEEVRAPPQTSDALSPSWMLGFDGASWDGAAQKWGTCEWNGKDLAVGDKVGVLVNQGLTVFVNGKQRAVGPRGIPGGPLYAVVDLLSAVRGVTLAPEAKPPAADAAADSATPKKKRTTQGTAASGAGRRREPPSPATSSTSKASARDAAREMTGFHRQMHGPAVSVSDDGLAISRQASKPGGCLAMTDGRLPKRPDGSASFRFKVTSMAAGHSEGMSVGVTTRPPYVGGRSCPETAESVEPSWLAGFDGASWDGARQDWGLSDWQPAKLARGDVVEVRVPRSGELEILVNRRLVASHPLRIPTDGALAGLVDLVGNSAGVSLLLGEDALAPPKPEKRAKGKASSNAEEKVMSGFRVLGGSNVSLSADRRGAVRQGAATASSCVVVGDGVLPHRDDAIGFYAFHVVSVVKGKSEGMAVGVTSRRPSDIPETADTADKVLPAWLVGFDGAVWDGALKDWALCDWDAAALKEGDHVQVAVTAKSELQVFVNGRKVVAHSVRIPPSSKLYALMDLTGATTGISLDGASVETPSGRPRAPGGRSSGAKASPASSAPAFHRSCLGRAVALSADGHAASAEKSDTQCLLLSEEPIRKSSGNPTYELVVTSVRPAGKEGLGVGFTTVGPGDIKKVPDCAHEVSPSWLVGYDGATWDGSDWATCDWTPAKLAKGDVVQVMMTQKGVLHVDVNGVNAATFKTSAPRGAELYALVDLLGATAGVELRAPGSAAERKAPPAEGAMGGFDRVKVGKSVKLSSHGTVATRAPGATEHCVVMGDRPLDKSCSFSIKVAQVAPGADEGFAIGMTTTAPTDVKRLPSSADQIANAWLVGYDGATWDGENWGLGEWRPSKLREGDVVIAAMAKGELEIKVNGKRVQTLKTSARGSASYYAVLDLLGSTVSVAFAPPAKSRQ